MRRNPFAIPRPALSASLIVAVGTIATAQQPPQQPPQTPPQPARETQRPTKPLQDSARSPEAMMERFTRAIDPEGKLGTVQGIRTVSQWTERGAREPTEVTVAHARPNSVLIAVEGPSGTMKQGYNGNTGWSSDGSGTRTLGAAETEQLRAAEGMQSMGRNPSMFRSATLAEPRTIEGKPADCLRLTWKSGAETTECYSRETGLLVESRSTQQGAQGNVETVTRYYDYQPANGILVARRLVNEVAGQSQEIKVTEVAVGPVDPSIFSPPGRARRP